MKTRFKIFCKKISSSYLARFGIFGAIILFIMFISKNTYSWPKIYGLIANSFINISNAILGKKSMSEQGFLYVLSNFMIFLVLIIISYYIIKYIRKLWSGLSNSKVKSFKKKLNLILSIGYGIYIVYFIAYAERTVDWTYSAVENVIYALRGILFYDTVLSYPTVYFGVNFAARYLLLLAAILILAHIPFLIHYIFVEKIAYEKKTNQNSTVSGKRNVSRFAHAFWNFDKNKFRTKNIIQAISLIGVAIIAATSLVGRNEIVEIINYLDDVFRSLLLWSDVENTPFSNPPEIAAFVNIMIRVVIAMFYIISTILCAYVIKHLWNWLNGKEPNGYIPDFV